MSWLNHDYCHCKNSECPKKDSCYRYFLYQEDLKGNSPGWCSYAGCHLDEKGECDYYIETEEDDGKDK